MVSFIPFNLLLILTEVSNINDECVTSKREIKIPSEYFSFFLEYVIESYSNKM